MVTKTLFSISLLLLTGCAPTGVIYSDTTVPFTRNFSAASTGMRQCEIRTHQIKEPVTGYNLYSEWTSGVIAAEAKHAGINNISYLDRRTVSVLFGLYRRETLIVHGD